MKIFASRWLMIAGLGITVAATSSAGCSSSDNPKTDGGTGGSAKDGGGTGGAGGAVDAGPPLVNYIFSGSDQGWKLNPYADPNRLNLAGNYGSDAGVPQDAAIVDGGVVGVMPTWAYDPTIGSPDPGSLKISVTFTGYNQYVDPFIVISPIADLTHNMLRGRLQLTSGAFSGGAQLHVQTGADYAGYAASGFTIGAAGTFAMASIDLDTATSTGSASLNPAMVISVGIQIFTGDPPTVGAAYPNAGVPVVFNIDTVTD
jgi:hypothetical protein